MAYRKCGDYEAACRNALKILTGKNYYVQGRNPNIDYYYSIWKGKPKWLKYSIYVNGEEQAATYLTLNVPRYISKSWANNYANENTTIVIPDKNSNDRLQEILFDNNLFGKFNSFVDSFMGLGLGAIVVNATSMLEGINNATGEKTYYVDPNSDVEIRFVSGRRVIPITLENGEVTECAFLTYSTGKITLSIHFINDRGFYTIAEVEGFNKEGNPYFDFETIKFFDTESKDALFTIWRPNVAEDDEVESGLGQSIYNGAEDTFKQCDLAYTALWKELKLGQKQLFVASDIDVVDENGKHSNPFSNMNTEGITSLPAGMDGKTLLQEFNGELRVQQLLSSLNTHLNCAAMLCGLGQSTFEFDGAGGRPIQTATGVIAKQTELYRNVIKQENFAADRFRKLVKSIMYVNNEMTNNVKISETKLKDIKVTFDDNIVEDTTSKRAADLSEVNSGIMTIDEFRAEWYEKGENDSLKDVQGKGLLAIKYLPLLQSGAMSPKKFVELCYGGDKEELAYITNALQTPSEDTDPYASENDDEENKLPPNSLEESSDTKEGVEA